MNLSQSKNSIILNNTLGVSKVGSNEDFEKCSRRPLVLSSGDVDRMAVASSRARLMMDLVRNPDESSREFGSYYRGRKDDSIPTHVMTSHTASIPITKRVIPTYPSLVQNLRWNPSVETYTEDFQTEIEEDQQFHCRCHKCKMKQCRAREYPQESRSLAYRDSDMIRENFAFRDNIMRFTDNSTMTPKVTDAYCEACTPFNRTPKTSEVYISTSDDYIRDTVTQQTSSTYPIPILKKRECNAYYYQGYGNERKNHMSVLRDEAVRDTHTCNDYEKLLNSIPKREFINTRSHPTNRDNYVNSESCRKNLYNEGISDSIAETTIPQFVGHPMRSQSPMRSPIRKDFSRFHKPIRTSIKRDYSRITNKCVGEREPGIPYAHREHSKYHYDCKEPAKKVEFRYDDDSSRHGVVVSSRIPRPTQVSRVLLCDRPSGKLPKKLLTSERDIDSFVGSKRLNMRT